MSRRTLASPLVFLLAAACSSANSSSDPGVAAPNGSGANGDGNADAPGSVPTGGPCGVTTHGTAGLLLQGTVLAPAGAITGEVLVDASGRIACVDNSCASAPGYGSATVLACPGGVIAPGLINGHDHTEYNDAAPVPHATTRWEHRHGWRTGAGGEPKLKSPKPSSDAKTVAAAELRFVLGGATSVNGSGGVPGLLRNVAAYKDASQREGLGESVFFDTFPLGDSKGVEIDSGCNYPSIRSPNAIGSGHYAPHIAEGINAAARNELTCLKTSLVNEKAAIIHAVGIDASDVDAIAKAHAKVIWSARTNVDLYGNTAPVTVLKRAGVTIGLGTDWLASGSMNMLRELACVDSLSEKYYAHAFDDRALVEMATKNNALALGLDKEVGELSPGLYADVAIFAAAGGTDAYHSVTSAGVEDVLLVLRGGKPLYGEAAIIDALSTGCADLPVCGRSKKVCIDTPNVTLADIQSVASSSYPLFFCKTETPKDEPSCIPYRDSYPNGTSATDRDGDGVPDAKDICPDVFDPPRPLDGAAQSDVDKDGVGDACDAAPLDPSSH